jgi:hypothetical protein
MLDRPDVITELLQCLDDDDGLEILAIDIILAGLD